MPARYEYMKAYRERNRDKFNAYMRDWYKKNPDKRREYEARYWQKRDEQEKLKGVSQMNSIKSKYIETTKKACKHYYDAVKRYNDVMNKRDHMAPIRWQCDVNDARIAKDHALYEADRMIKDCRDTCESIIKDFYSVKPENMDSNTIALLNTGVVLKPADIEKLLNDNNGNPIMVRIISEYADEHNISFAGVVVTEADQIKRLDALDKFAHSGLRSEWYYNDVITDSAKINKIINPLFPTVLAYEPVEF